MWSSLQVLSSLVLAGLADPLAHYAKCLLHHSASPAESVVVHRLVVCQLFVAVRFHLVQF